MSHPETMFVLRAGVVFTINVTDFKHGEDVACDAAGSPVASPAPQAPAPAAPPAPSAPVAPEAPAPAPSPAPAAPPAPSAPVAPAAGVLPAGAVVTKFGSGKSAFWRIADAAGVVVPDTPEFAKEADANAWFDAAPKASA